MGPDTATPSPRVAEAWRKLSETATASEKADWEANLDRLRDVLAADGPREPEKEEPVAS
jgi:hypothetical protein